MLEPALADFQEGQLTLVVEQAQVRAWEAAVPHLLTLANASDELAAWVRNLLHADLFRLPDASAASLLQRQHEAILVLRLELIPETLGYVPLGSIESVLRVVSFDVLEPDCIPEDLLVLMRHDLELGRQLEFFAVNLEYALEHLADGAVALPYGRLQESLDLLVTLAH